MQIPRSLSLTILSCVAVPWAAALVVGGLWLLLIGARSSGAPSPALCVVGGITGIAAGHLVFAFCVADRVFPRASRSLVWFAELPICLVLFGGFGWIMVQALQTLVGEGTP